jgi:hypothetical protein
MRLRLQSPALALAAVLATALACSPPAGETGVPIGGWAVGGPTCPVQPANPKPGECDPRPVAGAVIVIAAVNGNEAVRVTTGADGSFAARLPEGSYLLIPQPADGFMGPAPPVPFDVSATAGPQDLLVIYDTGIR